MSLVLVSKRVPLPHYRGWSGSSLSAVAALALALSASACSYKLGQSPGADDDGITGSVSLVSAHADGPSESDLAFTRNAASDVLTRGSKDVSQPWENPATGARGSVTPLASAYDSDGRQCRDFLASYVRGQTETWMQGEACRGSQGRWEIKALRPWRRG